MWSTVLKVQQAQLRAERKGREGAAPEPVGKRQVRFREEQGERPGPVQFSHQIMDLKRLWDFTRDRLHFLSSQVESGDKKLNHGDLSKSSDFSANSFDQWQEQPIGDD